MCYALFTEPKGPETSQGTPHVEHPDTEKSVLSAASRAASPSQRWTFGTTLAGGSLHSRDHHVAGGPPTWAIIALQSRSEAGENGDATEIRPSVKFGLAVSMSLIEQSPRQGPTKRSNDREPTETGSQRGAAQDPHIPRARDALSSSSSCTLSGISLPVGQESPENFGAGMYQSRIRPAQVSLKPIHDCRPIRELTRSAKKEGFHDLLPGHHMPDR